MKKLIKYIVTFFIIIATFLITLTLTSLIPKQCIEKKVKESANILEEQKDRFFVFIPTKKLHILFDNYTDALMINTAYSINTKTPFYSALTARKNYIDGVTKKIYPDTIGELKSSSKHENLTQVGDLIDTVNNDTEESFEYARYWHGYLVLLRPLLIIFNITQIRILLYIILAILAIILLYLLYKRTNIDTALIFLFGLIICDYFLESLSLQGCPVFLIAMITSILILSRDIKNKTILYFVVGGLTSFFDFLTVPIITLGIPLLIDILISKNKDFKEDIKTILKDCLMWGIGYFGIFISKWIITDALYNKSLIYTAFEQLKFRTISSQTTHINIKEALAKNFRVVYNEFIVYSYITIIFIAIKILKNKCNIQINLKKALIYWIIGALGIIWYIVLKQHSFIHIYFTYRNFFLILTAFLLGIYNMFEIKKDTD